MYLKEFDYDLPDELIAQNALDDRGASRLMVVDRARGNVVADAVFRDLPRLLEKGDVLVVNRSRVVCARLFLRRASGGRVEILFIKALGDDRIAAWVRPLSRLRPGERLAVEGADVVFEFVEPAGEREGILRLCSSAEPIALRDVFARFGHVPLPPYIKRSDTGADRERYQTVFAREEGSVAAPTAGLHFDDAILEQLRELGIDVLSLALHVGPGTFSPLDHPEVEKNSLHSEEIAVGAPVLTAIRDAKLRGRRIIAVGTTVTRALESAARSGWFDQPGRDRHGETDLFVYPGFDFKVVDAMITNFHLPQSSLLILVSAFLGREAALSCYRQAVASRYRFFSYGDAMFIR